MSDKNVAEAVRIIQFPSRDTPNLHPAIAGLVTLLPPSGEAFPARARLAWLRAAANIFQLVYGFEEEVIIELKDELS